MTPLVRQFYALVKDAHKSHWFDVGDLKGQAVDLDAETLIRLPFFDITLVGTDKGRPFALHALTSQDTTSSGNPVVAVAGFALTPAFIALPILSYGCSETGDLQFWRKDGKGFDEVAQGMLGTLQMLVRSLDHGPRTAYLPVPLQTFTNRRKIAQGKTPAIIWNTIAVQAHAEETPQESRQEETEQGSRTTAHEPPRAHTRRGHWRHLKSGKKVWVRDCRVGDFKQGLALHDYKIRQKPVIASNSP